jgi:hypothetical protein
VPASLFLAGTFFAGLTPVTFLAASLLAAFTGIFLVGMCIDCLDEFDKLLFTLLNLEEDCYYANQTSEPNNRPNGWPVGYIANEIGNARYNKSNS